MPRYQVKDEKVWMCGREYRGSDLRCGYSYYDPDSAEPIDVIREMQEFIRDVRNEGFFPINDICIEAKKSKRRPGSFYMYYCLSKEPGKR